MLGHDGTPWHATIDPAAKSPAGPDADCGWKVQGAGLTVPLDTTTTDSTWWVRIGYLGSAHDIAEVRMGGTTTPVTVERGLHNLYVQATEPSRR